MNKYTIGIIGLGYVGLPLAVEFGKKYKVFGYDISNDRIESLKSGIDVTNENSSGYINSAPYLKFSSELSILKECNVYIITVPTPIDKNNSPDLSILIKATESVASILSNGNIIIYESTVYPGCTEEECVPILEKKSGLKYNEDFFCGYSPERISPGDKERSLTKIKKITSGSNIKTAEIIDNLYNSIITAGTYKASSIKVAEAAKIIENCQRDINIAFANELSILFNIMNIDSNDVIEAASTKWNFVNYKPGLVGGHCIGVDPYYLKYKAKQIGYDFSLISNARKLNNGMSNHIYNNLKKYFSKFNKSIDQLSFLILGLAFKENCSDIRNSKVVDIYNKINFDKGKIEIVDPNVNNDHAMKEYGINLSNLKQVTNEKYDCIIVAVAHNEFKSIKIEKFKMNENSLIYDIKGIYNNKEYMRL